MAVQEDNLAGGVDIRADEGLRRVPAHVRVAHAAISWTCKTSVNLTNAHSPQSSSVFIVCQMICSQPSLFALGQMVYDVNSAEYR